MSSSTDQNNLWSKLTSRNDDLDYLASLDFEVLAENAKDPECSTDFHEKNVAVAVTYPAHSSYDYPNQWVGLRHYHPSLSDFSQSMSSSTSNSTIEPLNSSNPMDSYECISNSIDSKDTFNQKKPPKGRARKNKSDSEKRLSHNQREQRRSNLISAQIGKLKRILLNSNIEVNDYKLDILIAAEHYIRMLQAKRTRKASS